jgi:hypothetical protein
LSRKATALVPTSTTKILPQCGSRSILTYFRESPLSGRVGKVRSQNGSPDRNFLTQRRHPSMIPGGRVNSRGRST